MLSAPMRAPVDPGWTSFVGREAEISALEELVASKRWVAIIGPPGVGKTRLASEVLRRRVDAGALPAGGLWWVALAGIGTRDAAVSVIASALELATAPSVADLGAAIDHRGPTVIVLDEIDALGAAANELVAALLRAAPRLHVLTTTLRRGGVGESSFDLGPLPAADAMRLFTERARAVRRDFDLAGHETAVAAVTRALDGLPLAVELAAARMRVMTPEQLARQPDQLLGSAGPVRAALDACWAGLTDRERSALAQLSVFRGGFDLEAASAVVDLDGVDTVLSDLGDASLIAVATSSGKSDRRSGPIERAGPRSGHE